MHSMLLLEIIPAAQLNRFFEYRLCFQFLTLIAFNIVCAFIGLTQLNLALTVRQAVT
jgi:hypothetical protein